MDDAAKIPSALRSGLTMHIETPGLIRCAFVPTSVSPLTLPRCCSASPQSSLLRIAAGGTHEAGIACFAGPNPGVVPYDRTGQHYPPGIRMIAIRGDALSLYQIPNDHGYQQNRSYPEQMLF
jgi:hypothetical protein